MKSRIAMVAALLVVFSITTGAFLQAMTLKHAQRMSHMMHDQLVYIQAVKIATLLNESGSAMGGYTMTRQPQFAEKFNKANTALPIAIEALGNLGPFEGGQAEAISQFKQLISESMSVLARARDSVTDVQNAGDMNQRRHSFMTYRTLRENGEKIQLCMSRLEPAGGIAASLEERSNMNKEADQLRMATVIWLPLSILAVAFLIVATHQKRKHQD